MKVTKFMLLITALFFLRIVFSFLTWHPDLNNHIDWGIRFYQYGPEKFYSPESNVWSYTWPNQPPGSIYIFAITRKVFEILFSVLWFINVHISFFPSVLVSFSEHNLYPVLLKLPAIVADFGIAYLIFRVLKKLKNEKMARIGAIVFLVNPVIWYNSSLWGQTDSIINFFVLLAIILLINKKLVLAILFLAISLYIKASLLIFVPIFLVIAVLQKHSWIEWVKSVLLAAIFVGVLTLPFSRGEPFSFLIHIYKDKMFVQQMQVITANAFNIWTVLTGLHEIPQSTMFGPTSYQNWGLVLFSLTYIPTLLLVLKNKSDKLIFWALSIASFSSFMFLTNMHERYLYPLFAPLTILLMLGEIKLPIYLIASLINLINLYTLWWFPRFEPLVSLIVFGDYTLPRLLSLLLFLAFIYLYIGFLRLFRPLNIYF
ncbi:hypothetical protein HY045_01300 [Candidatus Woesebacteria bacterium]|nr:hypothetical protein [Candidatus Woesebacteria bacterium]